MQCWRPRLNPWVRKIPWRREWLPTPIFLPGEPHGQRSLVGYSPWSLKEPYTTELLTLNFFSSSLFTLLSHSSPVLDKIIFQFSSVTQSCPTLCDPMNHSTPGLPVHHQLPEFTQTHVHQVSDAIQPSHPRLSPSPSPNLSQHQSLFQ